jgi:hypothetical protein
VSRTVGLAGVVVADPESAQPVHHQYEEITLTGALFSMF